MVRRMLAGTGSRARAAHRAGTSRARWGGTAPPPGRGARGARSTTRSAIAEQGATSTSERRAQRRTTAACACIERGTSAASSRLSASVRSAARSASRSRARRRAPAKAALFSATFRSPPNAASSRRASQAGVNVAAVRSRARRRARTRRGSGRTRRGTAVRPALLAARDVEDDHEPPPDRRRPHPVDGQAARAWRGPRCSAPLLCERTEERTAWRGASRGGVAAGARSGDGWDA